MKCLLIWGAIAPYIFVSQQAAPALTHFLLTFWQHRSGPSTHCNMSPQSVNQPKQALKLP